jgi:hypothetical protein
MTQVILHRFQAPLPENLARTVTARQGWISVGSWSPDLVLTIATIMDREIGIRFRLAAASGSGSAGRMVERREGGG